ncbi:MAG: hypoxanthine-guanine phosphoribosyltransferase, partial [Burkholderiales bacterium]
MPTPNDRAWNILYDAELVWSAERIEQALVTLGERISADYRERFPLVIAVMNGALYFAGHLLPRLRFPLTVEYVHATRYGDATTGGQLKWLVKPT